MRILHDWYEKGSNPREWKTQGLLQGESEGVLAYTLARTHAYMHTQKGADTPTQKTPSRQSIDHGQINTHAHTGGMVGCLLVAVLIRFKVGLRYEAGQGPRSDDTELSADESASDIQVRIAYGTTQCALCCMCRCRE